MQLLNTGVAAVEAYMGADRASMARKVLWTWALQARPWGIVVGADTAPIHRARNVTLSILGLLFTSCALGCASVWHHPCLPEEPRVASSVDGVPKTIWEDRAKLIKPEPRRY